MNNEGFQKSSTPKDRNCPYCNQPFTSSSLGRHLDLYIKHHNPKPPDGIHDVEEIRKARGGVTRRQPRSSAKRDSSTPGSTAPAAPDPYPRSHESPMSTMRSPMFKVNDRMGLGAPNWQATGVINDLPTRKATNLQESSDARREGAYHRRQKIDRQQRLRTADELDSGLAAELALKEVLWTLKDARYVLKLVAGILCLYSYIRARTTDRKFFDFNPFEHTFPSLCLLILEPPPTLYTPTPFPTFNSWSISPPSDAQFEALCQLIREKIMSLKKQRAHDPYSSHGAAARGSEQYGLPYISNEHVDQERLIRHVSDSYENWKQLDVANRAEIWQLEILRSLARVQNERRKAQTELELVRQELRQSRVEFSTRESGRVSKENPILHTPAALSLTMSDDAEALINCLEIDNLEWNYDRLVEKWRHIAKAKREARASVQSHLPSTDQDFAIESVPSHATDDRNIERTNLLDKVDDTITHSKETLVRQSAGAMMSDAERERYSEMDVDEGAETSRVSSRDLPGSSLQLPAVTASNIALSEQGSFRSMSPSSRQLPPISASQQLPRRHDDASIRRRSESRGW